MGGVDEVGLVCVSGQERRERYQLSSELQSPGPRS